MALVRWDKKRFPLKVWISEGKKLPEVPWEVITQDRVPRVSEMLKNPQSLEALPTAPGWKPEMNDTAANGFEEWRQDKTPPVPFGFVPDPTDADILVFFTDRFAGSDGPGGTSVHGQTYGQLFTTEQYHQKLQMRQPKVPVIIELRVNEELEKFQADAAHEFGHALGIKAHSPFRQDLMYVNRMVETPSPADLATLRALYTQTPKYWYY
jgi:predicted Zn-dependent protease